ncbi:putative F-box domain-containing protein [Tanacetum coccineum]
MTWKHIGHIKYCLTHGGCGVLFNAALHWFADDYNTEKRRLVILSFDLSPEEFKVIPVPDDSRYVVMDSKLGVFEDNLCISCADGIWVMRNYNVKQSWEFLSNDYDMNSHDAIHYLKIYDSTSPQKKRMTFFCYHEACLSRSWKDIISAPISVQSLVSPYINSERPSHTGSAKVAERECHEMRRFESSRKHSELFLRGIEELYNLEGGENEKSFGKLMPLRLEIDESQVYRVREVLDVATNNVAEYPTNMTDLCKVVKESKDKLPSFENCHVARYNSEADAQANQSVHLHNGEVQQEVDMK